MERETVGTGQIGRSIAVGIGYLAVVIFAGHGLGPIALLLVAGRAPEYILPVAAGWLGIAALIFSVVAPARFWRPARMIAAILILGSWFAFLGVSERKLATTVTSIPLFAAIVWSLAAKTGREV